MSKDNSTRADLKEPQEQPVPNVNRRRFFSYAGMSAAAVIFAASCKKAENLLDPFIHGVPQDSNGVNDVNLGSGDIGILNYAYALEQIEASFYFAVTDSPFYHYEATTEEKTYLKKIRDHEIAHREFFKMALGKSAIGTLKLDFTSIDFTTRDTILAAAKTFEDVGVSAYNGAGELLKSADYLLLAGKIVSVEARHAATLRDMIAPNSFSDGADSNGLDIYRKPPEVLQIVAPYVVTRIHANQLPTD